MFLHVDVYICIKGKRLCNVVVDTWEFSANLCFNALAFIIMLNSLNDCVSFVDCVGAG